MKLLILLCSIVCATKACSPKETATTASQQSTQVLYYNAKVYTVNSATPWAEALLIEGNSIAYVGTEKEARKRVKPGAKFVNLKGKLVLPGLHDVHMHPMEVGSGATDFELSETEVNAEYFLQIVRSAAQKKPRKKWIIGFGHALGTLLEARRNPIEILDEAVPNRPVVIMEHTSHSMWVNSEALRMAGIHLNTPNPQGGIIVKEGGKFTGILIDNAGDLVYQKALEDLRNPADEYDGMVTYVLPELAKHGITSVCDARTYWKRGQHKVWRNLAADGKLTARFNLGLWAYPTAEDTEQLKALKELFDDRSYEFLKINQIKLYVDGITHNTTAALHTNYLEDYFKLPTNNGLNYFTQDRLEHYIKNLESAGFDFHIHAIGNRGIHEALNAVEKGATSKGRHRITHVEMVDKRDLPRFKQLNITADAQVAGDFTQPQHWHENAYLVGTTLAKNLVPIKSLHEAGVRVTLSSDWNVSTMNPFIGLHNAVTRSPQNISLESAVKAYTLHAAYVMRQENKLGSLEKGKLADFIVLDRNIFEVAASTIKQTKVILTVFNGNEIYKR